MLTPSLEELQRAVGDRYEVLSLAGAGGMGAVFRARHRALGHMAAVKVLPPDIAASEMRQARFKREAALAASLSHPHIVPVYEFDTREGITFLIMPFVRGDTLERVLAAGDRGRVGLEQVLRVVREVGAALDFAHRRGIVHRDIKPSNILIEEDTGRALLTDFGIARVEHVATSSLTAPGMAIGTPDYMAPEQAAGSERLDGRADLYSLALVAFEALTGTRPALGTERAALARALCAARPELSGAAAAALVAPLALRRDDRPASAAAWLAAVDRGAAGGWRRRRRWLAAAGLAAAPLAGTGWYLCRAHVICPLPPGRPAVAVMPFTVLGASPYPAGQLPDQLIARFSPVPDLEEALSFGKVSAQIGTQPVSNGEADSVARRLGAWYFLQTNTEFAKSRVTLAARLYEVGQKRERSRAQASGSADSVSDLMDRVWAQILGHGFVPKTYPTLPSGNKDAIAAYLNAEYAFRRGDYLTARAEYTRVIEADSGFAIAHFRRALVAAQVDPTREGFGAALAGARRHQRGLSPADSLLLDGFYLLLDRGDGLAALERFKRASEQAPDYPPVWFVLGEFYYHFGNLFDQSIAEAGRAFNRVLDLDPRFAPALPHLMSLAYLEGDRQETRRLIHSYLRLDSTSVVAEAVGIADTLVFESPPAQLQLARTLCAHSFLALEFLAFQAAEFGTREDRQLYGRPLLRCLEQRAATDDERARALRMRLAADLRDGYADSARARLDGATRGWAARERDLWILLFKAAELPPLGDWRAAAQRVSPRVAADDPAAHWLLARVNVDRARHAVALHRLAADSAPLAASLDLDLAARQALARRDSTQALRLWDQATRRFDVLSVPFELVASLWPLRLDMARLTVARRDDATAARACGSFQTLMGYVDQVAVPEIERLCPAR